jgi:hypothetical protein
MSKSVTEWQDYAQSLKTNGTGMKEEQEGISSICRACISAGVGRMGEGGNANPYGKWQCA